MGMKEIEGFILGKTSLTELLGHQVSRGISAVSAGLQKAKDHSIDFKHAYNLRLMREQKYDLLRGSALAAIGLLAAGIINNSLK